MRSRLPLRGQRGVALLVALLVVALVTLLVAGLLDRGELSVARTRNALRASQAQAYAQGLEQYAAVVLRKSQIEQPGFDSNSDPWSIPLPPTPVPGGTITARMHDLNGCFNLNNLAPQGLPDANAAKYFARLLTALQLDPTLGNVVVDWLTSTPSVSPGGAKDNFYLAQPLPYRAANGPMRHVSELRLLKGVDDNVYRTLSPHVCVLPPGTLININTASVPVLRMLSPQMTDEQATRVWANGQAHYLSFAQLHDELQTKNVTLEGDASNVFGVKSAYFQARGEIVLDGLPFTFFSLLERRSGGQDAGVRVLARYRGGD